MRSALPVFLANLDGFHLIAISRVGIWSLEISFPSIVTFSIHNNKKHREKSQNGKMQLHFFAFHSVEKDQ